MQIGFNSDVTHNSRVYHIQTEDHGLKDGRITSQIFNGGAIVDSVTISYRKQIAPLDDPDKRDDEIRRRMRALHKHCYNQISTGKYDKPAEPPPTVIPAPPAEAVPQADALRPSTGSNSVVPAPPSRELPPEKPDDSPIPPPPSIGASPPAASAAMGLTVPPPPRATPPTPPPLPAAVVPEAEIVDDVVDVGSADPALEAGDVVGGFRVAGVQEELGEAKVAAHSRGVPMAVEELAIHELSDSGLIPIEDDPEGPATAQLSPITYHSEVIAFRGLSTQSDLDLKLSDAINEFLTQ